MKVKNISLVCIPYAGGSAAVYNKWNKFLPEYIKVIPFELSGRGKRFRHPLYESFDAAVDDLYKTIVDLDNENIAIFGHSMGALLAFELAHKMQKQEMHAPMHIFFSGRYPPNISSVKKTMHTMSEEDFKQEIYKMEGTPREVVDNIELWNIFSRIIRADYEILETYKYHAKSTKLVSNITVLHGSDDSEVNICGVNGWEKFTTGSCRYIEYEGGHFFIKDQEKEILSYIQKTMALCMD